jgi:Skp family chaperone for outer membrane proteins
MEDILAIIFIFGGGSLFLLAISPIGKAIAERIRGGSPNSPGAVHEALEGLREEMVTELQQMRKEVNELGERMDFAERMLAQHREAERLPPAR